MVWFSISPEPRSSWERPVAASDAPNFQISTFWGSCGRGFHDCDIKRKNSLICSVHTSHWDPDSDWNIAGKSEKHHKSSKSPKYSSISPTKLLRNTRTRTKFHCTGSTTSCRRAASRFGLAPRLGRGAKLMMMMMMDGIFWYILHIKIYIFWNRCILCDVTSQFDLIGSYQYNLFRSIWRSRWCFTLFLATVDFTFCVSTEPRFGGASGHSAGGWSKETWRRLADRLTMMEISFLSLKYVENDCFGSDSPTSSSDHQDYLRICTYDHCEFSLFSLNGSGSTLKARLMHWKEWFLIGKGKAARYLYNPLHCEG